MSMFGVIVIILLQGHCTESAANSTTDIQESAAEMSDKMVHRTLRIDHTTDLDDTALGKPGKHSVRTIIGVGAGVGLGTVWWRSRLTDTPSAAVSKEPETLVASMDSATQKQFRAQAAALIKTHSADDAEKAADLLRECLSHDAENVEIKMELADALNTAMRIRTHANSLVIEGTLDSPEFKQIWRTLGSEALPLALAAYKAMPTNMKALAVYADSFLYHTSSQGIIKQALTGKGIKYLEISKQLYKHLDWDSALGCCFLGGFYNVAPWPVGNKGQARKYLREGAQLAPTRRNLYYAGVNAYQMREYKDALEYFRRALEASPCTSPSSTEDDIVDFIMAEAERGRKLSEEALQSKKL